MFTELISIQFIFKIERMSMKWRFIYRGLKARYRDQQQEIFALIKNIKSDATAVDVGANKGSYLWSLSRSVPNGEVFAFEPQPLLADYLKSACGAAGLGNVTIVQKGVSNISGIFSLAIPGGKDTSPGASFEDAVKNRESCKFIDVATVTLDEFFHQKKGVIGALKIDVEGHELFVLKGATEILQRHKPVVLCEAEQRHLSTGKVENLFEFMLAAGYTGSFVEKGVLRPISEFSPEIHQNETGERFWDQKGYCNNFIFVRPS
jgi:FkbM family methyltransferase